MFDSILKLLLLAFVNIFSIFLPDDSTSKEKSKNKDIDNHNLLDSTKLLTGDEVFSANPKYFSNQSSGFWRD